MTDHHTVLLVDDSENDRLLMRMAFKRADFNNPLREVENGEEAIAYLQGTGAFADRTKFPMPVLILLDLNMPLKSGFDVLRWLRAQPRLKRLYVAVLTASVRPQDVGLALELGANSFLVKPTRMEELTEMLRTLRNWMRFNQLAALDG